MSTYKSNQIRSEIIFYSAQTAITFVVGFIYEMFSHQVYSPFMYLMFMIPLILGVIPNISAKLLNSNFLTFEDSKAAYKMGVLTLIFGSFIKGVLDIYGTSSFYPVLYLPIGAALLLAALFIEIYCQKFANE